jgi:hypothetical protein
MRSSTSVHFVQERPPNTDPSFFQKHPNAFPVSPMGPSYVPNRRDISSRSRTLEACKNLSAVRVGAIDIVGLLVIRRLEQPVASARVRQMIDRRFTIALPL